MTVPTPPVHATLGMLRLKIAASHTTAAEKARLVQLCRQFCMDIALTAQLQSDYWRDQARLFTQPEEPPHGTREEGSSGPA